MSRQLSQKIRRTVAERAGRRCEYCLAPLRFSSSPFSVEHIIPRAKRGTDELENLAFACQGCNTPKWTYVEAFDPVSGQMVPLFHPRKDRWNDHFDWLDDFTRVIAKTAVGRVTIERLQLNRDQLIELRSLLRMAGVHPQAVSAE